MLENLNFATN